MDTIEHIKALLCPLDLHYLSQIASKEECGLDDAFWRVLGTGLLKCSLTQPASKMVSREELEAASKSLFRLDWVESYPEQGRPMPDLEHFFLVWKTPRFVIQSETDEATAWGYPLQGGVVLTWGRLEMGSPVPPAIRRRYGQQAKDVWTLEDSKRLTVNLGRALARHQARQAEEDKGQP